MPVPQNIIDILKKRVERAPLSESEMLQLREWYREGTANNNLFGEEDWEASILEYLAFVTNKSKKELALKGFMSAADFKDQTLPDSNLNVNVVESTADNPHSSISGRVVHRVNFMRKWGWAAALIIAIGAGAYYWTTSQTSDQLPTHTANQLVEAVAPGGERAILTLADGSRILLDSAQNGLLAQQGNAQVVKLANGQLAYKLDGRASQEMLLNTMSTPRGGQFKLILPDGTKAWLNAASSITYPAAFVAGERKVKVSGEVYFEVAKDKARPFIVNLEGGGLVEVLGTHFNVDTYGDDGTMKTTLLEGSVKVNGTTLRPGQQAQVATGAASSSKGASSAIKIINNANINRVIAWKNGLFNFEGASLQTVMKQLERWYDIEVVYENGIPGIEFGGKLTRDLPLSDLLMGLERSDVHFRLEGRKLIVLR